MIWHFSEFGFEHSIFTCEDGSIGGDNCKLSTKPQPQWSQNWQNDTFRKKIYDTWAKLIHLKKSEKVFKGNHEYGQLNGSNLIPYIKIWDYSISDKINYSFIVSNFSTVNQEITLNLPSGLWLDQFTNNTFLASDKINLEPGSFLVLTSKLDVSDSDADGIINPEDNCPQNWNPLQRDKDKNGIGDMCDDNYLIISLYENTPINFLYNLEEYLPDDASNLEIISGNNNETFSISDLNIKLEKQLNFNDNNVYYLEVKYDSNDKIKPSIIILYVNYTLPNVTARAEKVESSDLSSKFEKYILYDPFIELIDEDKVTHEKMYGTHFTFSSFFSNMGPHDNIAFDYDINSDGLIDLILSPDPIIMDMYFHLVICQDHLYI